MTVSAGVLAEVGSKTQAEVDVETAWRWAERAVACSRASREARRAGAAARASELARRADDARHEALEHAALAGDYGETVRLVQVAVDGPPRRPRRRGRP